jgi:hypothetical protein
VIGERGDVLERTPVELIDAVVDLCPAGFGAVQPRLDLRVDRADRALIEQRIDDHHPSRWSVSMMAA